MNHDSWLIRIDHHWKLLTNQTSNNQHWIKQVNHHQQAHCHHHHDHHHHLRGKVCWGFESLNEPDEHLSDERKVWLPEVLQRYQPDRPVIYLPICRVFCLFSPSVPVSLSVCVSHLGYPSALIISVRLRKSLNAILEVQQSVISFCFLFTSDWLIFLVYIYLGLIEYILYIGICATHSWYSENIILTAGSKHKVSLIKIWHHLLACFHIFLVLVDLSFFYIETFHCVTQKAQSGQGISLAQVCEKAGRSGFLFNLFCLCL